MSRDPVEDVLGTEPAAGAPPAPPLDAPQVQRAGDEIAFTWPAQALTLSFTGLRESSEGVHAELSVVSGVLGEIHWSRINLSSSPAREQLVRKLAQALPGAPWRAILERACRDAAREIRAGEPVVTLLPRRAPDETRYLVPKLLLAGETNLLYADGGHGKSLLALAIGAAVATQSALPGGLKPSVRVPVMLLDWESYRAEHEDRLARYYEGLDVAEPPQILYRPMARALADEIARIRAEVARHRVGLVIVDSFAPACGAEPEGSDAAIRLMNALRSLAPATRLLLAHVSKASAEARTGLTRAFGSVFVMNLARNAWELRRADEDGGSDLVLAAFHRKANAGPLLPPLGFRFQFQGALTTLHAHDIGQAPELAARASLAFRIRTALAAGSRTVADLAETIEASEDSVSRTLRRLTSKGVVIQLGDRKPFAWGLAQ